MQDVNETIKFIIKSNEVIIPMDLPFLNYINPDICGILMTTKQYEVKSNIGEDIFRLFIRNCINKNPLNIDITDISQYEQICKEFDYMIDSVQLFKNSYIFTLKNQLLRLKQQIREENNKLEQKNIKYKKILHLLFNNEKIYKNFVYKSVRKRIFDACEKQNVEYIELLTMNAVENNGLLFIINEKKMEADLICDLASNFDVYIPKSIKYESKEFDVKRIIENSFESSKIKSIHFPEDSQLNVIEKDAFSRSSLQEILIPASVTSIETGAFQMCYQLKKVEFSKKSQLTLIDRSTFSSSSIEEILIPSHVTKICEYAFYDCGSLKKVEFEKNSQLKIIENNAFEDSNLESIIIPSNFEKFEERCFYGVPFLKNISIDKNNRHFYFDDNFIYGKSDQKSDIFNILIFAKRDIKKATIPSFITKIAQYAFYGCFKLKEITFSDNSQIESFNKNAFYGSSIEKISIPSSIVNIEEGCFKEVLFLTKISISPNNQNYSYYDDKFIVGKSDPKSDIFDVLVFARKDIKSAVIPSFICNIVPSAFEGCRFLKNIEFEENSKLTTIGHHAFYESSLKRIKIPYQITIINDHVFSCCDKFEKIEFENNSKLISIDKYAFCGSSMKNISIPSKVIQIGDHAFTDCLKLKYIKLDEKSKLKLIGNYAFFNSSITCFRITYNVVQIGKYALSYIHSLQICEFDENTKLKFIDKNIFKGCDKIIIMIPLILHFIVEKV